MSKQDSYRELRDKLDQVLEKMQSNELDVDEILKAHKEGMELIAKLEKYLAEAEVKLKKASKDNS